MPTSSVRPVRARPRTSPLKVLAHGVDRILALLRIALEVSFARLLQGRDRPGSSCWFPDEAPVACLAGDFSGKVVVPLTVATPGADMPPPEAATEPLVPPEVSASALAAVSTPICVICLLRIAMS